MAPTMLDKQAEKKEKSQWPADIAAEFERESRNPNPCVGSTLLSENERTRVWIIRLAPGERVGFHRHVLDYFWTSVSGGRGRQHVHDGTTIECTYQPGETRHESYGKGEFKVHDLENLGDREMVFMTVEFKDSANKPMPLPAGVRPQSRPPDLVFLNHAPAAASPRRVFHFVAQDSISRSSKQASQAASLPANCERRPGSS